MKLKDPRHAWLLKVDQKVIPPPSLETTVQNIREKKQSIVTINGSFDLLHPGHLYMLYEASKQADYLIVGLNTDLSIQNYKSKKRPLIPLKYRIEHLCALECVSYVTWFDETDSLEFIKKVKPDVHANGEEYGTSCIEAPLLKKIHTRLHLIPRAPGTYFATSSLIEKIHTLCD